MVFHSYSLNQNLQERKSRSDPKKVIGSRETRGNREWSALEELLELPGSKLTMDALQQLTMAEDNSPWAEATASNNVV